MKRSFTKQFHSILNIAVVVLLMYPVKSFSHDLTVRDETLPDSIVR